MNVALLFFLLLVPLSGFIAWAGDRIGHRTGKKRHSLFGLRPRHTATFITTAAGVGISLGTFSLMWVGNATFRDILRRGAELIQVNAELKKENDAIQKQVAAKQADIQRLDGQVADFQRQADLAAQGKAQAVADYRRAKAASDKARTELDAAKSRLAKLQTRLDHTGAQLADAQRQVEDARSDLARAERATQVAEGKRASAEKAQQKAQQAAHKAAEQLAEAGAQFNLVTNTQKQYLARQRQMLATQQDQLQKQSDQIADQQKQLALLGDELTNRHKELDNLRLSVREFRTNLGALRGRQITYRIREEVDRVSIPAGTNVWRIEFILDSLLNSSGKKAESRGAGRTTQTQRAVVLAPLIGVPVAMTNDEPAAAEGASGANASQTAKAADGHGGPNPAGRGVPSALSPAPIITESDLIRTAAEAIRRDNRDVVVIAVASANAVAGEAVPVDFRTFHNPVVLTAGTKIDEVTLDGTASRQEIVDALYGFLHNDIRAKLLQAGVIPPQTSGAETGAGEENGSIVTLSGDSWLKILDDIRRAGSRARVIVKADRTTRAADPVALRFEVKRNWDSEDLPTPRSASTDNNGVTRTSGGGDGSLALH